ncbi:Uncharacterised protein [Mycobacteroides abscessus]|nr:Uncharacterised protein [Mycobacteroides abscessus]
MRHTLWIYLSHNMFDNSTLTGSVHALQHQQHRAVVSAAPIGVEHLLQQAQASRQFRLQRLAVLARAVEARSGTRIDIGECEAGAVTQGGRIDLLGHGL